MRRFEVAQTAVFHEGDPSAGEFDLEVGAVVRRAKQHRLALQRHALFVQFEDAVGDRFGLVAFVGAVHELRRARTGDRNLFAQHRGESLGRLGGEGVGHVEDRGRRAVVDVQRDGREPVEVALGVEQEPRRRAPKAVDGLGVIADDGHARVGATQPDSTSNCRRFTSWNSSTRMWS